MNRIALWIFGPPGGGKSTLIARTLPPQFHLVDQDLELERKAALRGLPLDTRTHTDEEIAAFHELRRTVAAELWSRVPQWRREGRPLAFETTGDKPHLFQEQLDLGAAAGYRNLGIAVATPRAICIDRNRARPRVVSEEALSAACDAFERNLADGTYERMFGRDRLIVVTDPARFDIGDWLQF